MLNLKFYPSSSSSSSILIWEFVLFSSKRNKNIWVAARFLLAETLYSAEISLCRKLLENNIRAETLQEAARRAHRAHKFELHHYGGNYLKINLREARRRRKRRPDVYLSDVCFGITGRDGGRIRRASIVCVRFLAHKKYGSKSKHNEKKINGKKEEKDFIFISREMKSQEWETRKKQEAVKAKNCF